MEDLENKIKSINDITNKVLEEKRMRTEILKFIEGYPHYFEMKFYLSEIERSYPQTLEECHGFIYDSLTLRLSKQTIVKMILDTLHVRAKSVYYNEPFLKDIFTGKSSNINNVLEQCQ